MKSFAERLKEDRPIVHDGGFGSDLFKRGVALTNSSLACESHPDVVREVHLEYLESGAESITTNTFVASALHMEMAGKNQDEAEGIVRMAARQAQEAIKASGREAYVAGSIGPSPGAIEADGGTDFGIPNDRVREAHRRTIRTLAEEGVDFLCIETMFSAKEAAIAVDEARGSGLPIAVNMTFKSTKNRKTGEIVYLTDWGHGPNELLDFLAEGSFSNGDNLVDSVDVFGVNCGAEATDASHTGMPYALEGIRQYKAALESRGIAGKKLMAYPNAGMPRLEGGKTIYSQPPEEMAAVVPSLLDEDAMILGGCCGTEPAHIRAICAEVEKRQQGGTGSG